MKKHVWKRLLSLILCICLLAGCGKTSEKEEGGSRNELISNEATPTAEAEQEPTSTPEVTPEVTEGPALDPAKAEEEQEAFDVFLEDIFVEMMENSGLSLHYILEHPDKYGIDENPSLDELVEEPEEFANRCKKWQTKLETFSYDLLTESQKVNYDRVAYECKLAIEAADLKVCYSGVLSANSNTISNLSTYVTEYVMFEEKDVKEWLALLEKIPDLLKKVQKQVDKDLTNGLYPNQLMIDTTYQYIDNLLDEEDHPFLAAFDEQVKQAGLMAGVEDVYREQASAIIRDSVIPAMKEYRSFVETVETQVKESKGMCSMEGGAAYYNYLQQSYNGTNMNADEVFSYMEKKLDAMLSSYLTLQMLHSDMFDRYQNAKYEISDPEQILTILKEKIAQEYPAIGETTFRVSYLPEELQIAGVMAYYMTPQQDNDAIRIIRVNGSEIADNITLFSTLAHEGYPGHLYQDAYFKQTEGYHVINALFTYLGYQEGWAVNAGSKAYEWCTGDAVVAQMYDFDYNYSMTLAGLVDIGVNYKGWSKQQVQDYLEDYYIDDPTVADTFYDTVVADPGVYLPYTFGYFQLTDILKELQNSKGMSETEAMEAVLSIGPCDFDTLRKHLGL